MDYQVWTKKEYEEGWTRVDCGDLTAAKRELDKAVRAGGDPLLTVEVPYSLAIKVEDVGAEKPKHKKEPSLSVIMEKEVAESEANQSEAGPGEDTGSESQG